MLAGMVLQLMANKFRNPGAPGIPSFNPVHWFQPWKIVDWLTPKGLKLFYTGYVFLMFGIALGVLAIGLRPFFD